MGFLVSSFGVKSLGFCDPRHLQTMLTRRKFRSVNYEHAQKKRPDAANSRAGRSTRAHAERRAPRIGRDQTCDGVQRADLFTVALLGIARCGKTRSAGPLLRDDAAGKQQHRNDEQGAAHAEAFAASLSANRSRIVMPSGMCGSSLRMCIGDAHSR